MFTINLFLFNRQRTCFCLRVIVYTSHLPEEFDIFCMGRDPKNLLLEISSANVDSDELAIGWLIGSGIMLNYHHLIVL
jgi:hypothetical protein